MSEKHMWDYRGDRRTCRSCGRKEEWSCDAGRYVATRRQRLSDEKEVKRLIIEAARQANAPNAGRGECLDRRNEATR